MLDELSDLVTEQMRSWAVSGISIGLLDGDRVETATFGIVSIATNQPVTPETLFQIGSISKVFTTTLLMTFVDAGDLALDDPVVKYLPDFPLADREAREAITFRHLVTHLGGFYGDRFDDYGAGDDALALAVAAFHDLRQQTRPGELWTYCNAGFDLVGRVMEVVGGSRFEDLMRARVLAPLGMEATTYFAAEAIRRPIAVGHEGDPGELKISAPWPIPRRSNPAGGISTTPAELLQFVRMHLNDGELDGVRVISARSAREMRRKQTDASPFESWGLGWGRLEFRDEVGVRHTGATNGFTGGLIVLPERNFALAVLTNHDMGGNGHAWITRAALMKWFGLEWPGAPVLSLPAAKLEPLSGTYSDGLADYTLRATPDGLAASVIRRNPFGASEQPGKPFTLKPVGGDVFLVEGGGRDGSYADFIRNPDGSIRFLRLGGRLGFPQPSPE
jgi:CubicO group peptidase (beta-lactamase class C family)